MKTVQAVDISSQESKEMHPEAIYMCRSFNFYTRSIENIEETYYARLFQDSISISKDQKWY
ncbi:23344_t:CDS:2 [Cetraspora pellucida]|uniref:23344_t:CDS:1 n=1 Tax=Cetraspora pellucida TaxID=1433469 RepID=A0A9N8Z5T7_9GLOM|nr:23344_t:CDS:2 [Cetraspora pellucida]